MGQEMIVMLGQFGAAGLIGVLWVLERRHASARNRQLEEAHQRLVRKQDELTALLSVVKDNTRAISTLERGQRHLIKLLESIGRRAGRSR